MKSQVLELKTLRQKLIDIINKYSAEKREQILFDQWSLKEVLAHLCGWDKLTAEVLINLKTGRLSIWGKSVDEMNKDSIELRKNKTYQEIYNEYIANSQDMINAYESLPDPLWDKPLYPDKKFSPTKFLKIDIDHYSEHLEVIKQKL